MKPASIGHITAMHDIYHMTDLEIWRDTMCYQMPFFNGKCTTPDGIIVRDLYCTGCRYSNKVKP